MCGRCGWKKAAMPEGKTAMLTEFPPRPRLELEPTAATAGAMASHRLFSSASYLYTLLDPGLDGDSGEAFPLSMVKIDLTSPLTVCIGSGPLTCLQSLHVNFKAKM